MMRAKGLIWIVQALLLALILVVLCGWAIFALYFGDSATGSLQIMPAAAFGIAGLTAIVGLFIPGWRARALGGFLFLFLTVLVWWFNIAPSNDRMWQPDVAQLAYATFDGDWVTVHNIRNFSYRTETDYTPGYYTKTFDLKKLDRVDLYAVYWMGPAIAHTIISFGFGGKDFLAISIEARKEKGEGYSAIKGFFRQYELVYIVADERDVIGLRANVRKDPSEDVYRFRIKGDVEHGRQFFREYMNTINAVREHPQFYNTLTENCTNMIWMLANFNPDRVPFSWKILASGYAPEYLYDMGRLDTSVSFSELQKQGYVNPIARQLGDDSAFSQKIRSTGPRDG